MAFIRRGDNKMTLLGAFQQAFNQLHPDLRRDPGAKEELHLRTDELSDQLWQVVDKRREEGERELESIREDGAVLLACLLSRVLIDCWGLQAG